jgi:hypothetical protein
LIYFLAGSLLQESLSHKPQRMNFDGNPGYDN